MPHPISPFDSLPRDCWLNIDAAQLAENVRRIVAHAGQPALVAVKANGYGHGYEIAAKAFLAGGASYLGVANLAEGLLLRNAGIEKPILIIGGILPHDFAPAAAANLDFLVFRPDHVAALRGMPKPSQPVRVHIKIDTGMGRIGCFPEEAPALAKAIREIPGVHIAGLSTHFAKAATLGNEHTTGQIALFDQAISALNASGIRPDIIHAANSSGSLYYPHARYDMMRLGIAAYGVRSSMMDGALLPDGVKPAMSWHARITSSRILPKDSFVSYGCEYQMPRDGRIGVLPFGYSDGFRRLPKNVNTVLVDGQERPVRGRVNMDQCMVDLTDMPDMTGEEIVMLGKQGDKEITIYDLVKRWEDNDRNILGSISPRVPRRVT